jgi:short-subunit dehydrogenase
MPKQAVITGASSGLGAIFADQLAKRGHSLVLAGRDETRLTAVAQRVDTNVELVVGDLGTTAGVDALLKHLGDRDIDVLVHTAVYRHLAAPEPVVAAGLRALDRGRAVVVPGWRNRMTSTFGRLAPGSLSAFVTGRMLQPANAKAS